MRSYMSKNTGVITHIVDTNHTDLHALDRAFYLAKHKHIPLHLHGMCYGYSEKSGDCGDEQLLLYSKLSDIRLTAERQGITTTTSSSFGNLWERSFLSILKYQDHPTVVTSYPDRHLWNKWLPSKVINRFIFDFPCNVIMVKDNEHWSSHKALILLGPELADHVREELKDNSNVRHKDLGIMNTLAQAAPCGKQLKSMGLEAYYVCIFNEPHVVSYSDQLQYINANNDSHIIFRWGLPEQVVPPLIKTLKIDLLVVEIGKAKAMGQQEGRYIHQLGQLVECDVMAAH